MMRLIFIISNLSFAFSNVMRYRASSDDPPYTCFEKDNVPVDTEQIFEGHCEDIHGNKYEEQSSTKSCCECLIYTCKKFENLKGASLLMWNTSVSDNCCNHCDGVVYKADAVIDTIHHEDECQTVETSVCRILPGHDKASEETEFSYKNCCNDETGLSSVNSSKLEPKTCSKRHCFYSDNLFQSMWISSQILPGCGCCEVNGKLVEDKHTWIVNGKTYECCRGDIVIKLETQTTEDPETTATTTEAPTTAAPTTAAPTTAAPTTEAPTTAASTTEAPTTPAPTTAAPTTAAPTTAAPTTAAPTTAAQTTAAPTTEAPTTRAPTTAAPTTAAPTTAAPTTAAPTTEAPTTAAPTTEMTFPALEIKTGSETYDGCDCQLTAHIISPTGSCKTNVLSDSFKRGSVERISGSVLGSCNAFNPDNITAVTITHKAAQEDGWRGVLIKIILTEDIVFSCPLGKWIKESDNILSETFPCKVEAILTTPTSAPSTSAPTTAAPTTEAPTTSAPTTSAPTTSAPTTSAPTTSAPTTSAPTTAAPTTSAPTTSAPTTQAPTTQAPTTEICSLKFEVKSKRDAAILLSPCPECDGYEIVIGGWNNTKSVIRECKQCPFLTEKKTPNILSPTEFRGFWIEITKGDGIMISVGKSGEKEPFMETTFSKKQSILFAAFAGWNNNINEWKVNIPEGSIKVFSHNTQGGLFTTANVLDKNSEDPNADLYSILGQLHHLKINDSFNFRLCYPELKGINGSSCNDWTQSSNPATNSSVLGFRPNKPLAFTKDSYLKDWKGLGKNGPSVARDTFIDDAPTQSYWYSAVGAFSYWPGKPTIPGPRLEPDPAKRSAITKVDLSVYNEDKELSLTTKGYNYQYHPFFCFLSTKSAKAPLTEATTAPAPTTGAPTTEAPTTEAPTTAISFGCPDVNYNTEDENKRVGAQWKSDVKTWEACSQLCQQRSDCKYWTWHHGKSGSWAYKCVTMQNAGTKVYNDDTISGQRNCREGEDPTTPAPTTEAPTTAAPTTVTPTTTVITRADPTTTAITIAAPTKTGTTTGHTTTTTTKCDSGWMPFHQTGKCYRYFNNKTSWTSSLHSCSNSTKNPTATLVSIPNQATNNFLSTLTEAETWTGGYQKASGEWAWTDGSAWTYSSWHRLQPDGQIGEDFLETNWGGDGLWNDEPGNKPHGFLCQYDPPPCSHGWTYLEHTGQCYKSEETTLTRPQAILACKAANPKAHLAVISDKATNDFVLSMVKIRSLIGLSKVSDEWRWADGTKASYSNWIPSEPSGDGSSVEIVRNVWKGVPGQWNDLPVDNTQYIKGYVCQYDPSSSTLAPTTAVSNDHELISKDNLVATLPSWGYYFEVSLQLWIESWNGRSDGWSELLRFTSTTNDVPGGRIPALFANKAGFIYATSQVGSNPDFNKAFSIKARTWTEVVIKQYPENGKAIYEFLVNGKSVVKTENTKPTLYKNVKVWAAQGKYYPVTNAKIKDLEYVSNGNLDLPAGKITTGVMAKKFEEIGPFFKLEIKIKMNKDRSGRILQFTTGGNCCDLGQRIPGIYTNKNYGFHFTFGMNGNGNRHIDYNGLAADTWYTIVVSQKNENEKGRYQVTVNGKSVINELNNQPRSYKNVYLYLGSKHPSQDVDRDYYETMDISYEYLKYEPLP